MFRRISMVPFLALLLAMCLSAAPAQPEKQPAVDPLPSWKAGPSKQAILDFVKATTDKASPKFVPEAERIATFDNDGTLWVQQPMYTQLAFALDRVKALAPKHPDWQTKAPFQAVLKGDREAMAKFTKNDLMEILGATHAGMSAAEFHTIAKDWLATAKHPRFKRPYTECIYQPMLEVMRYLRANGFKTYIVTGGGQAFVRAFSDKAYGIPPEQVIGSSLKLKYVIKNGQPPLLLRLPAVLLIDDEEGKPEDIEMFIGRKPLAAFGNSDGDRQMLQWTQSGGGARLMMLVHHDDAEREYAYAAASKIGTFSDSLRAEAKKQRWVVISMKNDWQRVFPFEVAGKGLPAALQGKWIVDGGPQDGATFDFSRESTLEARLNNKGQEAILKAIIAVEDKKLFITTQNPNTLQNETRSFVIRELTEKTLVIESATGEVFKMGRAN